MLEILRVREQIESNIKYMWEQVKCEIVERELQGSVRVGVKNPKSVWWND